MSTPLALIENLEAELIARVQSVPAFKESGFSIFDVLDFEAKSAGQTLPTVGIAYDGMEPTGNDVNSAGSRSPSIALVSAQFIIVIAVQYRYTAQDDTKQQAYALLDQVRAAVMGYQGVNSRPWRFIGERPEANVSGDGVIFYSQVWQTALPVVGTFNNL